jgi:lysozyme
MRISDKGLNLIKQFEGLYLTAYKCPAGVWTIGWGCTKGVRPGQQITREQAEAMLRAELAEFEAGVNRLVNVPLTQSQFDALVSFAYNVGLGALSKSTLLSKLNKGDYEGAAAEFPRWNKGGGKVLAGLIRRRAAEQALFQS